MRIETPGPVRKPLPLTPLVDVVFLLLMFFMLSTTFARFGLFGLGNAAVGQVQQAGTPAAGGPPGVLIDVRHGPIVRVNGSPASIGEIAARLNQFEKLGVAAAVVRPAADADVQDLVTVLEAARLSHLKAIALAQ